MKAQILKHTGLSEDQFYKKYKTREDFDSSKEGKTFKAKYGANLKKAQNGMQSDTNNNGIPDYLETSGQIQTYQQPNQLFAPGKVQVYGPQNGVSQNSGQMLSDFGNAYSSSQSAGQGLFGGGDAGNGGLGKAFGDIGKNFGIGGGNTSAIGSVGGSTGAGAAAGASGSGFGGIMKTVGGMMGGSGGGKGGGGMGGMMGGKGGGGGGMSNASGYIEAVMSIVEGIGAIKGEKKVKRQARVDRNVVNVVREAYDSKDVNKKQNYMDNGRRMRKALMPTVDADALFPTYGTGTNPLAKSGKKIKAAKNGGEIMNTYAPGTLYDGLADQSTYQPIENPNVIKSYQYGGNFGMDNINATMGIIAQNNQMMSLGNNYTKSTNIAKFDNAGGKIGSGIGQAVGTYFGGPLGGTLGKYAGKYIGGALDSNYRKIANFNYQKEDDLKYMRNSTNFQNVRAGNFGAYTKNGGKIESYRSGGNLRQNSVGDIQALSGGYLEPISYNPEASGDGVTSMIRGQSHDESNGRHSGVILDYNGNHVEAERGEPISQRQDGGSMGESVVIAGDQTFNKLGSSLMPHLSKYEGKKIKNIQKEIAEKDAKLNKFDSKNAIALNEFEPRTAIDKLTMNSYAKNAEGIQQKYKINAREVDDILAYQDATNETAKIMGADAGALSRGKIKYLKDTEDFAQNGKKIKSKATVQPNPKVTPIESFLKPAPVTEDAKYYKSFEPTDIKVAYKEPQYDDSYSVTPYQGNSLETLAGQILPWFRQVPGEGLQMEQIAGELGSLGDTPEEVQARFYHPTLRTPYDISYQDQLNENQSDFNQLVNASSNNPAALQALAAQKYNANSRVLGEQFRANQSMREGVYSQNTATLNDALLKNLSIADQQYVRQSQAASNTKAVKRAALDSIASKTLQNNLENKRLQVGSNEFKDFSYDSSNRLNKTGGPTSFYIPQNYTSTPKAGHVPVYDTNGNITGYQEIDKTTLKQSRNGSIVKAFKDL